MPEARNLDAARTGWPGDLPDWVERLATACDASSQSQVARALGLSASAVNAVLRGRYGASTDRVEQVVRGRLMAAVVPCPQLGELQADLCQEWQARARRSPPTSFHRRMQAACLACRFSRMTKEDAA